MFEEWKSISRKQATEAQPPQLSRRLALALGIASAPPVEAKGSVLIHQSGEAETPFRFIAGKAPAVLMLDPGGIAAAETSAEFAKFKSEGRAILLIDAFQTGSAAAPRDRSHTHFLTFNRSDDAARTADVAAAISWLAKRQPGALEIAAAGKARYWALFAAAATNSQAKLLFDPSAVSAAETDLLRDFFVPGLMRAGGVDAARRAVRK